ncbi:hypothetical protein IM511_05755 [Erythrobacteraceae bacterium E2-1 Yellow Sea]|nr:hypothetical protein [Erythrobacteraceae bacterium E2-1 Yellow Sea]
MIEAKPAASFRAISARLTQRAQSLANARAHQLRASRHSDGRDWRDARLLWPLFSRN